MINSRLVVGACTPLPQAPSKIAPPRARPPNRPFQTTPSSLSDPFLLAPPPVGAFGFGFGSHRTRGPASVWRLRPCALEVALDVPSQNI